jgi:hypothetical protein
MAVVCSSCSAGPGAAPAPGVCCPTAGGCWAASPVMQVGLPAVMARRAGHLPHGTGLSQGAALVHVVCSIVCMTHLRDRHRHPLKFCRSRHCGCEFWRQFIPSMLGIPAATWRQLCGWVHVQGGALCSCVLLPGSQRQTPHGVVAGDCALPCSCVACFDMDHGHMGAEGQDAVLISAVVRVCGQTSSRPQLGTLPCCTGTLRLVRVYVLLCEPSANNPC